VSRNAFKNKFRIPERVGNPSSASGSFPGPNLFLADVYYLYTFSIFLLMACLPVADPLNFSFLFSTRRRIQVSCQWWWSLPIPPFESLEYKTNAITIKGHLYFIYIL